MIYRFRLISGIVLTMLFIGGLLTVGAQTKSKPPPPPPPAPAPNPLIQMLPSSDAVISFDAQKFLTIALPQILGAGSPRLTHINAEIEKFKNETGIDPRIFERAAVGLRYKEISATTIDVDPVVLVSGKFNAPAMMTMIKLIGKYREEQASGKTIYILKLKELLAAAKTGEELKPAGEARVFGMRLHFLGDELAVGALDEKTLAIGSVARVQETFRGNSLLDPELNRMATVKPGAVVSFAGKAPEAFSRLFGLDNEEIAKMLDSIKTISGYLDMNGTNASLMIAARSASVEEATNIEDTVIGLKELGKVFLAGSRDSAKPVYLRLIDNAKITRFNDQVQLNLLIPQNDISILSGILIKKLNL